MELIFFLIFSWPDYQHVWNKDPTTTYLLIYLFIYFHILSFLLPSKESGKQHAQEPVALKDQNFQFSGEEQFELKGPEIGL